MGIPASELDELEQAGYRFVGKHKHSAVKICHWTRQAEHGLRVRGR